MDKHFLMKIYTIYVLCTYICMYGVHVPRVKSYQASTYCVEHLMPERALAGCEYNVNKEYYSTVCSIELSSTYTPEKAMYKAQVMYASTRYLISIQLHYIRNLEVGTTTSYDPLN